jgi:ElaB/YqjD/DUF883 family membrane-anchored ribosome-binding protein
MTRNTKDTFGYLGTEPMAARELFERMVAALEAIAKAEGAEAMKAARETARHLACEAEALVGDLAGKAREASAAAGERREAVEGMVRERPWLALSLAATAGFLLATLVRR